MKNKLLTTAGYQNIRVSVSVVKGKVVVGVQDTNTGKIKYRNAAELANEPSNS